MQKNTTFILDTQNTDSVRRLRMCGLLLTVIFCRGEPMPVQYFEQLGPAFVSFLLDYVEAPPTSDSEHEIPDVFIGLALSYNLQFTGDVASNVVVNCLAGRAGAKTWTEKVRDQETPDTATATAAAAAIVVVVVIVVAVIIIVVVFIAVVVAAVVVSQKYLRNISK